MKVFIFYISMLICACAVLPINLFVSCAFETKLDEERVTLILPDIPAETKKKLGISRWKLVYPDKDGNLRTHYAAAETNHIAVVLPKNSLTTLLCFPLLENENNSAIPILKPAGALYPANVEEIRKKTVSLTWQAGFSASFLMQLLLRSQPSYKEAVRAFSYFNWRRFQAETFKHANPWLLDSEKLYTALINEKVTVYSFTSKPRKEFWANFNETVEWIHSTYIPEGFMFTEAASNSVRACLPLTADVNVFVSPRHILHVNAENTIKRLVISAIQRYTE